MLSVFECSTFHLFLWQSNYSDTVKPCPWCWFTNTSEAAVDESMHWLIPHHSEPCTHRYMSHDPIYRGISTAKGPHESTGTHNTRIWTWGTVLNLGDVIPCPLPRHCSLSWACARASPHSPTNWYLLKAASSKASLHISNLTGEPGGSKTNDPHRSIHMQRLEKMRHFKSLSFFVT